LAIAMATLPQLNAHEARVLGVLIEKDLTTPEGYPLSLNSATLGSNQKSNRDPVVEFVEAEVQVALTGLLMKGLAGKVVGAGSRVEKHRHNAREALGLSNDELAVLAELLLRGAQQPGELRSRAARMAPLPSPEALNAVLARLIEKGFVRRLPPRPGERSERYGQLLAPDAPGQQGLMAAAAPGTSAPHAAVPPPERAGLEARLAALEARVAALEQRLGAP
jgi:uncharacterized protein YceH (UPF0502 family)